MKIAHVLRRLSFEDWGGTEQVVWNIAKAQVAAGHEVRIFATNALGGPAHEVRDGLEICRFKAIYPWWPMPKRLVATLDRKGGNPFVPGLGKAVKEWNPDVIHCHAMGRIAELCIRLGPKCVVSLHGGSANVPEAEAKSLVAPTRGRIPWGKAVDLLLCHTRRVPEDADGIVCVGADEYERYSKIHLHVMYLPNGVDTAIFKAPEGAIPKKRNPDYLQVVCVARIDRQKNQMMLVEALARRHGMRLRLVGPVTQPDYQAQLEARAKELGVEGRIAFAGALKPGSRELVAEYRYADVFALPSRHEPFGIAVLEAWAAGTPVVASDVGGLARLCRAHPKAAILFQTDKELDAALEAAARDREKMSAAGLEAAREYDWKKLASELVAFYGQL